MYGKFFAFYSFYWSSLKALLDNSRILHRAHCQVPD